MLSFKTTGIEIVRRNGIAGGGAYRVTKKKGAFIITGKKKKLVISLNAILIISLQNVQVDYY